MDTVWKEVSSREFAEFLRKQREQGRVHTRHHSVTTRVHYINHPDPYDSAAQWIAKEELIQGMSSYYIREQWQL